MRAFNTLVFDEIISGTGTNWYTSSDFCDQLGGADYRVLQGRTSFVSGTSPTLTVQVEHSPDGHIWSALNTTAEVNATAIVNDGSNIGNDGAKQVLAYVRCRIALGGTSPKCRLKLYVTGHSLGR